MFNILIVEDDNELRELFSTVLSDNGFNPYEACDGSEALSIMDNNYIDLIISDIMMPNMDGYELTKSIRSANMNIPILMITAKDGIFYKREGFMSGVDDYMVKPVDVNEMIWRTKALLRRSQAIHERKIEIGNTLLNCDSNSVTVNNSETILPPKEFSLLLKLISSPNRTFTRIQLMEDIWGLSTEVTPHTLEVHIGRLRERFKDNEDFQIVTVRGLGYKVVTK